MKEKEKVEIEKELTEEQMEKVSGGTGENEQTPPADQSSGHRHYPGIW